MVTELDHQAIIERIVAILKNNSSLYDKGDQSGTKLRDVIAGIPLKSEINTYPYAYVAFKSERDQPFDGAVTSLHTFQYNIVVAHVGKDGRTTESQILDIHKTLKETLKGNRQLIHPTDEDDAKCKDSHPISTRAVAGVDERGKPKGAFEIVLECIESTA